jgi:hypothetical protein
VAKTTEGWINEVALLLVGVALAGCGGMDNAAPAAPPPPTSPSPTIASVSPPSGAVAGGTLVAITGTDLGSGVTVSIGGAAATVASASSTQITATTAAHPAGAADVVVTRSDGQHASRVGGFTYTSAPPPVLSAVSPPSDLSVGGATITLSGANFASPVITFGGVQAAVGSASPTSITVTAPPHAQGAVDVVVTNGDGQRDTLAAGFSYLSAALPAPVLTSLAPLSGPIAGGMTVTLTGVGFSPPVTVTFGGATGTVTGGSATSISVQSPPHPAGSVDVVVTNPDGQSTTLPAAYAYSATSVPPPPVVTSLSPTSGATGGGTVVVVAGSGFDPAASVTVGGASAAVVSRSGSSLTVNTPPMGAGPADLVLSNPDGQRATLPGAFLYVAPPALVTLSTVRGPTAGGTSVTLTGSGFATGASVSFGGSAASVSALSTTSLAVMTPAHGAGLVDVRVSNADGQAAVLVGAFTYEQPAGAAPVVASVAPGQGPVAGGTTVTISGANFVTGISVLFGGVPGTVVGTVSASSFVATTPVSRPAGAVDVTVVIPGSALTGALLHGFTFLAPPPTVQAMSVRGGPYAGGTIALFAGTGLQAGTVVTFGGAPATGVSYDPVLDRLQAVTPPDPLGPATDGFVDVAVTNPDGQTSTLAGTRFHYGPTPVPTSLATVAPVTLATVHKGDTIVITGTDFTAALAPDPRAGLQVSIGGIAAIVSRSPTQIVVTAPKNNPGTYQVVVVNFDGQYGIAPGTVVYPGP